MNPAEQSTPVQVKEWMDMWWKASTRDRRQITLAWRRIRDKLKALAPSKRWAEVRAPLSATITCLLEIGWQPWQPNLWLDSEGARTASRREQGDQAAILAAITQDAATLQWREAAKHTGGGGLEKGCPDFGPARSLERKLSKADKGKEVAALAAVICGRSTTGSRGA